MNHHTTDDRRTQIVVLNHLGSTAFMRGWFDSAEMHYGEAIALLTWEEDDLAASLYENLGLVYINQGRTRLAIQAFERALDGDWVSRQQSLRYLVHSLAQDQRYATAKRRLDRYVRAFGPHPDGWTHERLDARSRTHRASLARSIAVS
ncbi:MAG: tetratricopeptide repeat protein [Myxococcota bacterium]